LDGTPVLACGSPIPNATVTVTGSLSLTGAKQVFNSGADPSHGVDASARPSSVNAGGPITATGITNSLGVYTLHVQFNPFYTYTITISAPGYNTFTAPLTLSAGQTTTENAQLTANSSSVTLVINNDTLSDPGNTGCGNASVPTSFYILTGASPGVLPPLFAGDPNWNIPSSILAGTYPLVSIPANSTQVTINNIAPSIIGQYYAVVYHSNDGTSFGGFVVFVSPNPLGAGVNTITIPATACY
jgi:hypothetical protein